MKKFSKDHPKLWRYILNGSVDLEEYERLVQIQGQVLQKMPNSSSEKDKIFQSSVEVGEVLARKYLYPVKKPSKSDKDKAYQQALHKFRS